MTSARAAFDRFPGTLLEGAVADMLNSGAFAANLRKVRGLYREARDVLASTLSKASDGKLSVPVPSQGLHLVARFDPSIDPHVAAQAKAAAGVPGWLLAETYSHASASRVRAGIFRPPDSAIDCVGREAGGSFTDRTAGKPQNVEGRVLAGAIGRLIADAL